MSNEQIISLRAKGFYEKTLLYNISQFLFEGKFVFEFYHFNFVGLFHFGVDFLYCQIKIPDFKLVVGLPKSGTQVRTCIGINRYQFSIRNADNPVLRIVVCKYINHTILKLKSLKTFDEVIDERI